MNKRKQAENLKPEPTDNLQKVRRTCSKPEPTEWLQEVRRTCMFAYPSQRVESTVFVNVHPTPVEFIGMPQCRFTNVKFIAEILYDDDDNQALTKALRGSRSGWRGKTWIF